METKCDIQIRHYQPEDYADLRGWWKWHGAERMHESIIPTSSCVVEDSKGPAAFAAVFLCNSNHMAFCHGLVVRPEMKAHDTFQVLEALQDGIDIIMQAGGHSVLHASVEGEAMLRGAKRLGFHQLGKQVYQIGRVINTKQKTEPC